VAVNCAAFSETLLEGELFGHERGAFTGADRRRLGQFERANRGTLFMDEIGEMSVACQAKLLRVLEGHPFERLGGNELIRVDVRIVAATHRNLNELVRQGRFREDLFYRLHVIELRVPPLRERGDDVLALAVHFLEQFRRQMGRGPVRLSERAAGLITRYAWPGNVRELKNAVQRAVVLGNTDDVQPADLDLPVDGAQEVPAWGLISLEDAERRHIQNVLDQVGGNKTRACEILGIGRATLYKKLGEGGTGS
jgi:Nif-specific regulatory protein